MNPRIRRARGFTLVEIMTVVVIVGILSSIAVPALMRVKRISEDTLTLNTLRQLYDAKEYYFTEDGAAKPWVNVAQLVKAGYASHSLDAATLHNIGAWNTTGLRANTLQPGKPIKIMERFSSGNAVKFGRTMVYPDGK